VETEGTLSDLSVKSEDSLQLFLARPHLAVDCLPLAPEVWDRSARSKLNPSSSSASHSVGPIRSCNTHIDPPQQYRNHLDTDIGSTAGNNMSNIHHISGHDCFHSNSYSVPRTRLPTSLNEFCRTLGVNNTNPHSPLLSYFAVTAIQGWRSSVLHAQTGTR
jgi:hypothetical protein